MKQPSINCQLYHEGCCSHASAHGIFGNKPCILLPFNDPRIGSCRVQIPHARPNPPPAAP